MPFRARRNIRKNMQRKENRDEAVEAVFEYREKIRYNHSKKMR